MRILYSCWNIDSLCILVCCSLGSDFFAFYKTLQLCRVGLSIKRETKNCYDLFSFSRWDCGIYTHPSLVSYLGAHICSAKWLLAFMVVQGCPWAVQYGWGLRGEEICSCLWELAVQQGTQASWHESHSIVQGKWRVAGSGPRTPLPS